MFEQNFKEIVEIIKSEFFLTKEKKQEVINNCIQKVKEKVEKDNLKSLVMGISGGLDSAVVAICQEKNTGVPLIGISIPMGSSVEHRERAKWVGETYCTAFDEFNGFDEITNEKANTLFDEIFKSIEKTNEIAKKAGFKVEEFPTNILKGNVKARLRMITLYDMARKTNGLVLSTDNFSEYLMGFWTINGDVGDFGPIQNIYKGLELPFIAEEIGIREDIINQKPSDGLMVTADNTDEAQLGASYPIVDVIMNIALNPKYKNFYNEIKKDETVKKIIKRYYDTQFKRTGTINLTRNEIGLN